MSGTWHAPAELLAEYESGRLDPARAMSVETHLAQCPRCRAALPGDPAWLARSWERLAVAVAAPRPRWTERLLRRCGVPEHLARLLAVTPALSRAWLAAVTAVLGFAVVFAYASHTAASEPARLLPFLLTAPVLPLAGVALAYGRVVDPAYEVLAATPMAGARLLLWRASAVLVAAVLPAGLAASLLPGPLWVGAAWLLPALALTVGCLALATRVPLPFAAGGLALAWVVLVLFAGAYRDEPLVAFHAAAQLGYAVLAVPLLFLVYLRRQYLDPEGRRWNQPSRFAG